MRATRASGLGGPPPQGQRNALIQCVIATRTHARCVTGCDLGLPVACVGPLPRRVRRGRRRLDATNSLCSEESHAGTWIPRLPGPCGVEFRNAHSSAV